MTVTAYMTDVFVPLLMATILGGAVGLERESANRPAGFRTHILVCVGSALVMLVSIEMFKQYQGMVNADPGRIAAQVISGIGFLGAGTIMREGATIRGLTTAASLWVVAGIGLASGSGLYIPAFTAVVFILFTLKFMSKVERLFIAKGGHHTLVVLVKDAPGQLGAIASVLGQWGVAIRNVQMQPTIHNSVEITFYLKFLKTRTEMSGLMAELLTLDGVLEVHQED